MDTLWEKNLFRRLLMSVLSVSFAVGLMAVLRTFRPAWQADYVLLLLFAAALESIHTTELLVQPEWRWRRTIGFRLGELLAILIVVRVVTWLVTGQLPTPAHVGRWFRNPGAFFDGEFITVGFLTLVCWFMATVTAQRFSEMALRPDELRERSTSALAIDWHDAPALPPQRTAMLESFGEQWIWVGIILVVLAAASRFTFTSGGSIPFSLSQLGLRTDMLVALVAYFVSGLLLMSQGRLAVLRGRWRSLGIEGVGEVTARWPRYAVGLIVGIAILAALLPRGSSSHLGQWLATTFSALVQVLVLIVSLPLALLSWLASLLGSDESPPSETPAEAPPPFQAAAENGGLSLPDWLGGLIFWLIIGVILVYALNQFLSGRGISLMQMLRSLTGWVKAWWALVGRQTQAARRQVRKRVTAWLAREPSLSVPSLSWHFINPRRLSPREQVRFYYLAMLRRAAERGVSRPPAATPLEHAVELDGSWPEVDGEIDGLTEAFVEARYAPDPVEPDEARQVAQLWQRVRKVLRRRSR